jgi:lantibiotic biosynthesis protein
MLSDPRWTAIARTVADAGIERYESRRIPWPSGLHQGHETPDLMLGIAGIGYFYLRMSAPSFDSVLRPFAPPFLSKIGI